jgi:hypothetical protein
MFVLPEEEKSHLQKQDCDGLTDALTQSDTNRDPRAKRRGGAGRDIPWQMGGRDLV